MKWLPLAIVCIAATGQAATPAIDAIYVNGETLDYSLTWLKLTGGSARFTIGIAPGAPDRFRITSVAQTTSGFARIYKVRDQIISFVDRVLFTTIQYEKHLREGSSKKNDITTVDRAQGLIVRKRAGKPDKVVHTNEPVFDPISLIYQFRRLDLRPGSHVHFMVTGDGKLYAAGLFADEDSKLTIWYSDDARHLPVRIRSDVKIGSITATLKGVRAGVTAIEPDSK